MIRVNSSRGVGNVSLCVGLSHQPSGVSLFMGTPWRPTYYLHQYHSHWVNGRLIYFSQLICSTLISKFKTTYFAWTRAEDFTAQDTHSWQDNTHYVLLGFCTVHKAIYYYLIIKWKQKQNVKHKCLDLFLIYVRGIITACPGAKKERRKIGRAVLVFVYVHVAIYGI